MTSIDSEKIASAYKKERSRLLGYISSRIHDRIEAEDILQDVFYQLTVGFNDIRRIENITAWLYRVTENRIIDMFRKKKPEMEKTESKPRLCPVESAGHLDTKLRRFFQNPSKILKPYIQSNMTVLDMGCGPGFLVHLHYFCLEEECVRENSIVFFKLHDLPYNFLSTGQVHVKQVCSVR